MRVDHPGGSYPGVNTASLSHEAAPVFARSMATSGTRGVRAAHYPSGTNPNWNGFQTRPQDFAQASLLRTENLVGQGAAMPPFRPGAVNHGAGLIVGYTISPSADHPDTIGQLHVVGAPGAAPALSQGLAYYAPFASGRTTGVSVPAHPSGGDPHVVLTPQLSGCAFYAQPDPHRPNNIIFNHRADAMHAGSNSDMPPGAVGVDYRHGYGRAGLASAFAFYDRNAGHWTIAQQNSTLQPNGAVGAGFRLNQVPSDPYGNPGSHSGALIPVVFLPHDLPRLADSTYD